MDTVRAAELFLDLAKAMAAFQETLVSGPPNFDVFWDASSSRDCSAAAKCLKPARCALEIFVGRGKCHFCHPGLLFTNGEFANAGMRDFIGMGE